MARIYMIVYKTVWNIYIYIECAVVDYCKYGGEVCETYKGVLAEAEKYLPFSTNE